MNKRHSVFYNSIGSLLQNLPFGAGYFHLPCFTHQHAPPGNKNPAYGPSKICMHHCIAGSGRDLGNGNVKRNFTATVLETGIVKIWARMRM